MSSKTFKSVLFSGIKQYLSGIVFGVGAMIAVTGVLAFQTMGTAPSTTGTNYSSNNSAASWIMKKGRAACPRAGSLPFDEFCLEAFTWTAANRATCLTTLNGWITNRPQHLAMFVDKSPLVFQRYGTLWQYGWQIVGQDEYHYSVYHWSSMKSFWNPVGGWVGGYHYNTGNGAWTPGPHGWAGMVGTAFNTSGVSWRQVSEATDNTAVNFLCASYRDPS